MGDIEEASFVLGKLTGQLEDLQRTQKKMFDKIDGIERSLNHVKTKNAGLAATTAIIFSLIVAFFKDIFSSHA